MRWPPTLSHLQVRPELRDALADAMFAVLPITDVSADMQPPPEPPQLAAALRAYPKAGTGHPCVNPLPSVTSSFSLHALHCSPLHLGFELQPNSSVTSSNEAGQGKPGPLLLAVRVQGLC